MNLLSWLEADSSAGGSTWELLARNSQQQLVHTLHLRRLQRGFLPQCAEQNHDHLICKIPPKHRLTGRSQAYPYLQGLLSVKILSISQGSQSCPALKKGQIPLPFPNKMFVRLPAACLVRDLDTAVCQLVV